jgi:hypothetical protein
MRASKVFTKHISHKSMSYSQYTTLQSVRQKLGIKPTFGKMLHEVKDVVPTDLLLQILDRNTKNRTAYFNEKARSEGIVFPILSELQAQHNFSFALYSGANIEGEKELGLNGECDFVLSNAAQSIELERPVFCIVEAKDNDIELGIPQCIAQLCGAQLYNQRENIHVEILYGAVTTGTEWNFLQLHRKEVLIDNDLYSLKNLPELLGALSQLIQKSTD